jgi:chemosensory pili system protein ChpB (putative protein-glutamate methylesterase)
MAEPAMRVALLARPGAACDNLQAALREAGAEVVLVADPNESDAGTVAASLPRAVLVALEPGVEDALDGYQGLLQDPAVIVIYDEVAVAARREGWDAARWVRHLAAKLGGHRDVLPPGAEAEPQEADGFAQAADAIDFGGFTDEMKMALALDDETVAPADEVAPVPEPSFANLTLEEISPEPLARPAATAAFAAPAIVAAGNQGGVVVLAGIGGPDAVRQFLSALPLGFPRAVVVRQRLDGGRHDRLVRQMQRATALPVELAQAGARLAAGHVYILPDAMTTAADAGAAFVDADGVVPVLAGLPAEDSAVLVLSGGDPAAVAEVLAAGQAGAFVAAQALEECFDSAAPAALAAAGALSAAPAELANRLAARWPNP